MLKYSTGTDTFIDDIMAAYFCSRCSANWPVDDAYKSCPDCGQYTFHNTSGEPDAREPAVEYATLGTQTTNAYAWRVERYLELGFTEADAHLLASSEEHERDSHGRRWTRPLNWHRVDAALAAGCSRELALQLFAF